MKLKLLSIVGSIFFFCWTHGGEGYHTFTSRDGKNQLEARLVNVVGKQLSIMRKSDKRTMVVAWDTFSEADQPYLWDWALNHLKNQGRLFQLSVKRQQGKKKTSYESVRYTNGKIREKGLKIEEFPAFYKIILVNKSELTLRDLKISYVLFGKVDKIAAQSKNDFKLKRKQGEEKLPSLIGLDTFEFNTDTVTMRRTELTRGNWVGGGDDDSGSKLVGIKVIVKNGDKTLAELIEPSSLLERIHVD